MSDVRKVEFTGTGWQFLGWGLLYMVLASLIIPAAWGIAALSRWFVKHLKFSDGTTATFEGRGGQIWYLFVIMIVVAIIPSLVVPLMGQPPNAPLLIILVLAVVLVNFYIWILILRWMVSSTKLSCGTQLSFTGDMWSYIGWLILMDISMITIIGWAWVLAAFTRWLCRKVEGGQNELVFTGKGLEILWRTIVTYLACIFIITIPWACVWYMRWYVSNLEIREKGAV